MEYHRRAVCFLGCVMVFGLLFVGGCKRTVAVNSRWANEEIVVDGQDSEWRDGGLYYDDKTNTKIGIRNDSHSLYVCLICKDENIQRQILQGGFTLWVSQDKKKNKLWGLRYPVGTGGSGEMGGPAGPGGGDTNAPGNSEGFTSGEMDGARTQGGPDGNPPGGGQGGPGGGEPGGQSGRFSMSSNEFELLSSEDDQGQTIGSEELSALGIEGKISQRQGGGLIYEVKIPLNKTDQTPYAAAPSKKGGYLLGFVSEKTESQGMGGGMGGGMSGGMGGGGMGGGMGGMNFSDMGGGGLDGGMGGGMGGGGMGNGDMGRGGTGGTTASSIELWAWIQLAAAPGSGT